MQEFIESNYKIISDNIKKVRLRAKLSQENFAEKLDCTREYISRVEHYKEKVSLRMLLKIAYIFNFQPKYFFTKSEKQ